MKRQSQRAVETMDRPDFARIIIPITMAHLSSIPMVTILRPSVTRPSHDVCNRKQGILNGSRPRPPQRIRFQLLAGLRRRVVDAGAVDRVPVVGVPRGAV